MIYFRLFYFDGTSLDIERSDDYHFRHVSWPDVREVEILGYRPA